jgi:hypothetical protein
MGFTSREASSDVQENFIASMGEERTRKIIQEKKRWRFMGGIENVNWKEEIETLQKAVRCLMFA